MVMKTRIAGAPDCEVDVTVFYDAVLGGLIDPQSFKHLWVESGDEMSGGSGNQLELPRLASRFFVRAHTAYDDAQHVITMTVLHARGGVWDDRPLTWHGNNRMERINLPTRAKGGFTDYTLSAVLFSRRGDGSFDLAVEPLGSLIANQWRAASVAAGTIYSLGGPLSSRDCGVF
jgi:hypothetical protein